VASAPERILAITFTNKAADELKERLGRLIPEATAFLQQPCTASRTDAQVLCPYAGISQNLLFTMTMTVKASLKTS